MISVTVAAHGRSKRCVGANLRAYGSGRLSICDLDKEVLHKKSDFNHSRYHWTRVWKKCCNIILVVLKFCFPSIFRFLFTPRRQQFKHSGFSSKIKSTCIPYSPIHQFSDAVLLKIFQSLDGESLIHCELVCKRWNSIIENNINILPKISTDQIRILFDEGEVIMYPVDEKKCPVRYHMPSLQILARRLRHLTAQSLFVRGMIPIESEPVLRSLRILSLRPQQIYFIWSKFSPNSIPLLEDFITLNKDTVVDFGLEECSPPHLFTDKLLASLVPGLTSLRLWNNGKCGNYAISDMSVYKLATALNSGKAVETVDLASCGLTENSLAALILAWFSQPQADLSISLNYCPFLDRDSLIELLTFNGVYFTNGKLRKNGYCLTLFC